MQTEEYRELFKKRIMELFADREWMLGIWEGGSAATGFLDDLSDLDLGFVVDDDRIEEAFTLFEGLLIEHYGIKSRFRLPEPSWHGHSQCYYFVDKCPPLFYVDLLVEKKSAEDRLIEPDRHGRSRIWLNRENVLNPVATAAEEMLKRNRRFFQIQADTYPISETETEKQLLRGNEIDAMLEYQGFIQRKLAALLNLKYRPAKYDFGIRYGDREYPEKVAERVRKLMYAGSIEEIKPLFREASAWARELMEELKISYGK